MIHTTRWRPDTCDCILEYTWDDQTTEDNRVHTFARHLRVCAAHAALNGAPVYNAVMSENVRKNRVRGEFLTQLGTIVGETKEDGSFDFKRGITISWSWVGTGADRILHIAVIGIVLTTQQKQVIQNRADTLFGAGTVVID